MAYFPEDLTVYTPGTSLAPTRQLVFGNDTNQYVFPLTFQETQRDLKLALMKQRVPFNWGDHCPPNTSVNGRDITFMGSVGSLLYGSNNNQLVTYNDLEAERTILSGLQTAGRQKLWSRWDRYCIAYLAEFDFKFQQDGGLFRYADWTLKFFADDPRYYSKLPSTITQSNIGTTTAQSQSVTHNGNVKAYPTFTFTVNGLVGTNMSTGPYVMMAVGANIIKVVFSKLTIQGGDTLTVTCDPRPEHRIIAAVYTNSSGVSLNALQYINGATDLVNTLDYTEVFPFIPNGVAGCDLIYGMVSGGPNYNVTLTWSDTWL
jgi:hypothetical protein